MVWEETAPFADPDDVYVLTVVVFANTFLLAMFVVAFPELAH